MGDEKSSPVKSRKNPRPTADESRTCDAISNWWMSQCSPFALSDLILPGASGLPKCACPLKKCFHALRPLLCVRGVERHGGVVPVEFARLLPLLNDRAAVLEAIGNLSKQCFQTRAKAPSAPDHRKVA